MNTTKGIVVPAAGGTHLSMGPPGRFAALKQGASRPLPLGNRRPEPAV